MAHKQVQMTQRTVSILDPEEAEAIEAEAREADRRVYRNLIIVFVLATLSAVFWPL